MEPNPIRNNKIFSSQLKVFLAYYVPALILLSLQIELAMLLLYGYLIHVLILVIRAAKLYAQGNYKDAAANAFTAISIGIIGFGACALPFFLGGIFL